MRRRSLARLAAAATVATAALAATSALALAAPACTGVPTRGCLLPFPNDYALTKADRSTPTKRRVALPASAMPVNTKGARLNPAEWNRNDGFSPGEPIIVHVPSLTSQAALRRSGIVPVTDLAKYKAARQPLLLLDEQTGRRQMIWGELDANPVPAASRNLIIHPAKNLVPGRRYVVVLRNLRDRTPAGLWRTASPALKAALRKAKVAETSVYLTWDFTVASDRSLTARMLKMRNEAFARLGDRNLADGTIAGRPPAYAVTGVTDFTAAENPRIARTISGTFTVPCYLDQPGCPPGARLHYSSKSPDALPTQMPGNVQLAKFQCNIPRAAFAKAGRIAIYGHGLLFSRKQIDEDNIQDMSAEHDMTFCATDWSGMSEEDVPNAIKALGDFNNFPTLPDRLQQGVLNTLYLGRLLAHPQGFAANAAFRGPGGAALLDTSALFFDGNSQGAIIGGMATALAPDWRRAVLGVATMDFATLLPRSTDFDAYSLFFTPAYKDGGERLLILSLAQMLWDRGETDGWAHHVTTSPPAGTPTHTVLMHVAVGDHQTANVMSDVEARTIGASAYRPAVDRGRSSDVTPLYGIPTIPRFPFAGSAIVYWDGGPQTPLPPTTNTPPRTGLDPHTFPRSSPAAREQKSRFLSRGGAVVNVCGGKPCHTSNYK